MDELYFEALKSLLVIMLMLVARYVIPYIKSKISNSDYAWIYDWTVTAVKAAEQTITESGMGNVKKLQVKDFINKLSKEKNLHLWGN